MRSRSFRVITTHCALFRYKNVRLLSVLGHCGIRGDKDANALAREESTAPFLGPQPADSVCPCDGSFKAKESLNERHSECWAAVPGLKQWTAFE